jgi:hypothetical protein
MNINVTECAAIATIRIPLKYHNNILELKISMCFDSLVKILRTSRRLIFSAFSPWAENPYWQGFVRLSVNTTHSPVLKISTTGFALNSVTMYEGKRYAKILVHFLIGNPRIN